MTVVSLADVPLHKDDEQEKDAIECKEDRKCGPSLLLTGRDHRSWTGPVLR